MHTRISHQAEKQFHLFAPGADEAALMAAEAARVEVLNGAGVAGLAQATANWLLAQGVKVVAVDTADRSNYPQTQIVDFTGKPHTAAWLTRTFGVLAVTPGSDPSSPVDIKLTLGTDWVIPVSGSSTR